MDLIQKACNLGFILKNKEYYLWEIQRWLREVFNVDILINRSFNCYVIEHITKYNHTEDCNITIYKDDYEDHETYEEALEKGLQEALKLI